ncbi:TrbI/VirB10 family protein [Paracraurococcus lichenis]|uniref:TrbI/VirB10 family protein n=1 Tax=Paracraurococcus lichenis TaxID=3064888 RepID=A0ABT9EB68_9PROT|nr:TrbI/VirB10 family protein [Paracraurococcus sp. LOR1-02]MDO9713198.1 TrbI/VirB10 family protein [Paracraurococcus sp. LOR1-02]
MSVLDPTTPTDQGRGRAGPWTKIAMAGGAVLGLFTVVTFGGMFSAPPGQHTDDGQKPKVPRAEPFVALPEGGQDRGTPRENAPAGGQPAPAQRGSAQRILAGQQGGQAGVPPVVRLRPPPPITISTYTPPAAPTPQREDGKEPRDTAPPTRPPGSGQGGGGDDSPTSLGGQLNGGIRLAAAKAGFMPHPEYMILTGTQIPCVPVETYNSAMGGLVTCKVPQWVRGDGLRIGLLPPGTTINGQIRGGMAQGQPRLGVLYSRIVTSGDRFVVNLQGLGSDAQGRSGLDADINTFFWETTGAVALYALIQGTTQAVPLALQALLQSNQGNGNTYNNFGGALSGFTSGGGGQGLANRLLADRLNRQPEAERDWSLPMFVTVGQDLDFHDICRQRRRVNQMACPAM